MPRPNRSASPSLRAVLYLRQSTYREESISLELQEHEGRAYAERNGYEVVAVEADPGISGRTWNRPAVQRVMQMIDSSTADIIVLWKWSRLSRSRLDWAVAADRVETAGGRIESATEPIDTTTSTGRFARGMMTEFAAFESERIGDVWKESHARRIRNGLPANGKPRFGYSYSRADGFKVDPITGPVLAEAFRRYISGESVYSLVQWLNAGTTRPVSGYGVKTDGLWSDRTLRRVMDSGFAAGFIRAGSELHPGAHPAIIDAGEWSAYLEARQRRRNYRRIERSDYLLSGLVRCQCGSSMTAGLSGAGHVAKYRCKASHQKRTHSGGYVTASLVERFVFDWLVERQRNLERVISEAPVITRPVLVADPSRRLRDEIASMRSQIDRLGERAIELEMPRDSYLRQLEPKTIRLAELEKELLTVQVRAARPMPVLVLPNIIARWDDIPIAQRREILRDLIDYVRVTTGRPRASFEVVGRD